MDAMGERDDDEELKDARMDRTNDPNRYYRLKKQLNERKKAQEFKALQKDVAKQQLKEKQQKLQKDVAQKGIVTGNEKPDAKQMMNQEEQHEDAQKQLGTTEQGAVAP